MENKKLDKKVIFIGIIIGIIAITTISLALFSALQNSESGIRIGEIKVDLEEDWPEPGDTYEDEEYDEFGIELYEKNVKGVSKGDLPAYVRIRCIPVVEYYYIEDGETEGTWITAPVAQEEIGRAHV